jgi:hypothetical protein
MALAVPRQQAVTAEQIFPVFSAILGGRSAKAMLGGWQKPSSN